MHTMIVLKFIGLVYLPFVTFGNKLDFPQSRTIISCEDEKRNISCAYGNLSIEKVIFPQQGSRCNTVRYCDDKATQIQSLCNGQKWCEVGTNAFIHGRCTKVPRHIVLNYACSHIDAWNRLIQSNQGRVVCGSLKDVQCNLHYTEVISSSKAKYDYDYHDSCEKTKENIQGCLTNGIISACDKKYTCDETKIRNTYCFFKPFRIEITYSCDQGPTKTNMKSISRDSIFKPSINRTSTKQQYDEGTGNVLHGTKYYMQVKLDTDFRVLIYDERQNKSFVLCPNIWTDTHATIVCRQFNLSDIGFAVTVSRQDCYKQLHVDVNCSGYESTLLLCRFDRSSETFCENSDAAVRCTTLNTNPVSSTEVIVPPSIPSNMTGTEIGVISSIVFIATVLFVIVIIYRKNKKWKHNSESNISIPINYQNLHRNDGLNETSNLYVDANATNGPYSRLAASVETENTSYPLNDPQRGHIYVDHLDGMEGNMENNYFLIEPSESEATMDHSYSDIDNLVASSSSRLQRNSLDQNNYFVLDPNETRRLNNVDNYSEIKDSLLTTVKERNEASKSNNYDHYAISKEGVYDETNNRRHVNHDDVNIYDRSLGDAYDSMTCMKTKTKDITYDHLPQPNYDNDKINN
ncbi:uncharacterized protein LOC134725238 isoform X2 [Mytilus trossulus]|uniref:uncharacterized protein LOC134725238 isoform X2 n=1 Tax=Mytilus trossulus TaxID=6551 RepID=UPI0030070801